MKIYRFNESQKYKEYEEYSDINMNVLKSLLSEINEIKIKMKEIKDKEDDIRHDLHQYTDFIRDYVVFDPSFEMGTKKPHGFFIPSEISYEYNTIFFKDTYKGIITNIKNIEKIQSLNEIAENDQKLFLELYNFYIIEENAPYMDVFGKDEYRHLLDSKKYNI